MLSPGSYHESVPSDQESNLRFRLELYRLCREEPKYQAAVQRMCEEDLFFFMKALGWQFNPKRIGNEVEPFIPWDFQIDACRVTIHRLFAEQRRVLWEKSRELGATWLALYIFAWPSLFHEWKKFLAISHSELAVYRRGDMDTLFGKLHFILEHLPDWVRRGALMRKLVFNFPGTHSSITGAATTERSGVGGRATAVLLDEFSKHQKDREIEGQMADTGPCLIIGTHYGTGTAFYEMSRRPGVFKVVMHWSQHPEKRKGLYRVDPVTHDVEILDKDYQFPVDYLFVTDGSPTGGAFPGVRSPWYDAECVERSNARNVAMHLDIDPQGATRQFFDPIMIRRVVQESARPPVWRGDVLFNQATGEFEGLVPGEAGPLKLWVNPRSDGRLPESEYGIGADIAQGTGNTPSCASGIDALKGLKVFEFEHARLDPKEFAAVGVALCGMAHGAKLGWESAGPTGEVFCNRVMELGYRNVFHNEEDIRWMARTGASRKPGWYPTPKAKLELLLQYKQAIYERTLVNRSEHALRDCLNFEYDDQGHPTHSGSIRNSDPSGARHNHGDMVIADAIAWLVVKAKVVVVGKGGPVETRTSYPVGSLGWLMAMNTAEDEACVRQWV